VSKRKVAQRKSDARERKNAQKRDEQAARRKQCMNIDLRDRRKRER